MPTSPTAISTQPTTSMSTAGSGPWSTANARIAPTAIRIRLTGRPTTCLFPLGVKQERARDARIVAAETLAACRVFLQRANREARAHDRVEDLTEASRALREVALAPVHEAVDAECDRMLLEQEQVAARAERGEDPARPRIEVADLHERAGAGVDEVEAAAAQLAWERLGVGLHPEDRGPVLPRELERCAGRVDARHDRAELRELRTRFAGETLKVQDPFVAQVGE